MDVARAQVSLQQDLVICPPLELAADASDVARGRFN